MPVLPPDRDPFDKHKPPLEQPLVKYVESRSPLINVDAMQAIIAQFDDRIGNLEGQMIKVDSAITSIMFKIEQMSKEYSWFKAGDLDLFSMLTRGALVSLNAELKVYMDKRIDETDPTKLEEYKHIIEDRKERIIRFDLLLDKLKFNQRNLS
jgi:hypothetical protein